jgi:hypothetical protein
MKTSKVALDVDFIGGQGALTTDEEKALSDFFRQKKLTVKTNTKTKESRRSRTTA